MSNKNNLSESLKYCEIKELFQIFDKDNDGFITFKELTTIMRSLGLNPTENELQEISKNYDRQATGKIEFNEFFNLIQQRLKEPKSEDELIEAFKSFDRDNEGILSTDTMAHLIGNSPEKLEKEEIDEILRLCDIKGDGHFTYEEFIRLMFSK